MVHTLGMSLTALGILRTIFERAEDSWGQQTVARRTVSSPEISDHERQQSFMNTFNSSPQYNPGLSN